MRIVENSYYDHAEHGRVKVVSVDNGVVSMEKQEEEAFVNGIGKIPGGAQQSAAGFQRDAEPADVTIEAEAAVFDLGAREARES